MFLYKNTIFYYDKRNITYQYNYCITKSINYNKDKDIIIIIRL